MDCPEKLNIQKINCVFDTFELYLVLDDCFQIIKIDNTFLLQIELVEFSPYIDLFIW